MPQTQTKSGLTGNQLKLIALITMTVDHIGMLLLPRLMILRIIGRIAMPLYAYMIAEGCRYTHDRRRYFLRLAGLALVCQIVYYFADRSLYQCILVTFSMSVLSIRAVDTAKRKGGAFWMLAAAALLGAWAVCELLPVKISGFGVDYGFFGVLLPVILYYFGKKGIVPGMLLLCLSIGDLQWWAMTAVPLMLLYNGQRGSRSLGWVFYLYYPLHLAALYGVAVCLQSVGSH